MDERCGRTDFVDQATALGDLCGMAAVFGEFMDYDGGRYGMALLSRVPFLSHRNHVLPPGAEPRSALEGRIRVGGSGPEIVFVRRGKRLREHKAIGSSCKRCGGSGRTRSCLRVGTTRGCRCFRTGGFLLGGVRQGGADRVTANPARCV